MNDDTTETKRCSHCDETKPRADFPHGGDCCRDCDSSLRSLRRHAGKGRGQLAAQVFVYFECGGGQRPSVHAPANTFPRPKETEPLHAAPHGGPGLNDRAIARLRAQTAAARLGEI